MAVDVKILKTSTIFAYGILGVPLSSAAQAKVNKGLVVIAKLIGMAVDIDIPGIGSVLGYGCYWRRRYPWRYMLELLRCGANSMCFGIRKRKMVETRIKVPKKLNLKQEIKEKTCLLSKESS